jgi:hypothetical protein
MMTSPNPLSRFGREIRSGQAPIRALRQSNVRAAPAQVVHPLANHRWVPGLFGSHFTVSHRCGAHYVATCLPHDFENLDSGGEASGFSACKASK